MFQLACTSGNFEIVKWLWETSNKTINIYAKYEFAFRTACINCHLDIVKFLWEISNKKINLHYENNYIFRLVCAGGKFEIVEWLLNISKESIIISLNDTNFFEFCCINNNPDVVILLLQIAKENNINYNINDIFSQICHNNYIKVANMLCSINTDFSIVLDDNKIKSYKINTIYDLITGNENNIQELKKIFKNIEKNKNMDYACIICMSRCCDNADDNNNVMLNLKCKNKYDHYYCIKCFCKWFRNNSKKCVLCFSEFKTENCFLILNNS
jgi:hypothetical protein